MSKPAKRIPDKNQRKDSKRIRHWSCPFCPVIVVDYRDNWETMELKIRNHLRKMHYDFVPEREIYGVLTVFKEQYLTTKFGRPIR